MNWRFLLFRGSYTYKKGLIVQSSSKTTQLLDPQNSDLLVKHIKHMSENKSECIEIGKRVTQVYMNNYDIEICLNKYVDEFYKAVERNV